MMGMAICNGNNDPLQHSMCNVSTSGIVSCESSISEENNRTESFESSISKAQNCTQSLEFEIAKTVSLVSLFKRMGRRPYQ